MEQSQIPKWQLEIEAILKDQFNEENMERIIKRGTELVEMIDQVERPIGEDWTVVRAILHYIAENLGPLAVAFAGFQLGAAYEKLQNADRV